MSEYNTNLNHFFSKIFAFKSQENWVLPSDSSAVFSNCKWSIDHLQNKKQELNEVKGLLNKFDLSEWSNHTKHRDPSSFIIRQLKQNFYPELLTQAWCKFYECLCQFPVVPSQATEGIFSSLHLCEAPGAFVCALNHYLSSNYPNTKWTWMANTLNPNHEGNDLTEMIPDDRFIKYTYNNWYFGVDLTGDISKYYNHWDLVNKINSKEKVWLVTADGSVDCMLNPGDQERFVEFLHYCETMTALAVLQKGGTFIIKIFTMFEDTTICLLYFLNCVFKNVSVFKPCSSKSGNSEVYVICTEYKGWENLQILWEVLLIPYKQGKFKPDTSMFDLAAIPENFLNELYNCSDFFMKMQVKQISDNVYHFKKKKPHQSGKVHYIKVCVAKQYLSKYKVQSIEHERRIVPSVDVLKDWRNLSKICNHSGGLVSLNSQDLIKTAVDVNILDIKFGLVIKHVKNSKFLAKEEFQVFRNSYISKKTSPLYELIKKTLSKRNQIININEFDLSFVCEFHKEIFYKLFQRLGENQNVIFVEIPFFTHFLAGLLFILVSGFESVHFHESGFLLLYGPDPKRLDLVKKLFKIIDKKYQNKLKQTEFPSDIIQLISPSIFDRNDEFFSFICNFNYSLYKSSF